MGTKLTENKGVNVLLAILIAVCLWVYVTTVVNPGQTTPIYDVPVMVNNEEMLSGKGLMIDTATDLSIDLKLDGSLTSLVTMMRSVSEISAVVDVSGISTPGEYALPCQVRLPNSVTAGPVTVVDQNNLTVRVTITKMMSKTVDVKGVFEGTFPDGYRTNDFILNPSVVTIQGPESVVKLIDHVQVTVDGDDLTRSYTGELSFVYVGGDGEIISSTKVVANLDTVSVTLPVVKTLEIRLAVDILPGGGATEDDVTYTITPETIQISGDEENVMSLDGKSITLGVIDLSMAMDGETTFKFPIALAPEIANDSGVSEATVTVTMNPNLDIKTFETQNIEIINAPLGYAATSVTQSLQVRVRGSAEALRNISDYQLRVVVDMKDQDFTPGQFRLKAKVYLDANISAGVIGENYVVVSVS